MTNDTDKIIELEHRIQQLESYLSQFDSYRSFNPDKTQSKSKSLDVSTKKTKGTRLQEEWTPTIALLDWARHDFPHVDLHIEVDHFRDYWISRADRGAIKLDWNRTFKNWIRNSSQRYRSNRETHKRTDSSSTYSAAVRNAFD